MQNVGIEPTSPGWHPEMLPLQFNSAKAGYEICTRTNRLEACHATVKHQARKMGII